MIADDSPAARVALAYFEAWTGKDIDRAMSYIADDIVCDAPAGRLEGAAAYREFMEPFTRILTGATMFAAFETRPPRSSATTPRPSRYRAPPRRNWSPSPTAESPPAASSSTGCRSKQHARTIQLSNYLTIRVRLLHLSGCLTNPSGWT